MTKMGRTYHSFKPQKLFEEELETNEFFDCKRKEWVTVIPARRYKFTIQLESDYPEEVFGAPRYYVMKVEWNGKPQVFGGGTRKDLGNEILRFKANECFWNNLGRHAYSVYLTWLSKFPKE